MKLPGSIRRVLALSKKETLQILRDPSSNIIAFVLPVIMLFIFGYGINLDSSAVRIGLLLEDTSPEAQQFAASLYGSRYFHVIATNSRQDLSRKITEGSVRGFIIVPLDFSAQLRRGSSTAPIQVVADGSEPNVASFVENYARMAWENWQQQRSASRGEGQNQPVVLEPRYWYNPSALSR